MMNKEDLQISLLSKEWWDYRNIQLSAFIQISLSLDVPESYVILVRYRSIPFILVVERDSDYLLFITSYENEDFRSVYVGSELPTNLLLSYLKGQDDLLIDKDLKNDLDYNLECLCKNQLRKLKSLTKYIASVNSFLSQPKLFTSQNIEKLHTMYRKVFNE